MMSSITVSPEPTHQSIWLEAGRAAPGRAAHGLWAWLKTQVDAALYRPRGVSGVTAQRLDEDGVAYYVLKNPANAAYLKLSESDYAVWTWMDGSHTVKDLVMIYFERYKTLAFGRITSLVDELKAGGFLVDRPTYLFEQVREQLDQRDWTYRWRRLAAAFVQHEFALSNLDPWITALYRGGGRLLFTPLTQGALTLLALLGLVGFIQVLTAQRYAIVLTGGSYWLGLVLLWAANFGVIVIHEHAHALTTKHFKREVKRGGVLIYYGMPAFFVDTMDIWMEPKRHRIAVTWAGPYSGLILGGLCGLAAYGLPLGLGGQLAFKTAFVCYLGVLVNLNPLLELDGYFILMDWLGIPTLRERSLTFIQTELWPKLKTVFAGATWLPGPRSQPQPAFNREETIFTAFGGLVAVYSLYTLFVAVYFWQTRFSHLLVDLWNQPDWLSKLAAVVFGAGVIVPVVFVASAVAWSAGRGLLRQLKKRRFFDSERNVTALLAGSLVLALAAPAFLRGLIWRLYAGLLPTALAGLSAGLWVQAARQHAGSRFRLSFWALAFSALLLAGGALVRGLVFCLVASPSSYVVRVALGFEQAAALPLLVVSFQSLLDVDLRRSSLAERLVILLTWAVGFVALIPLARWTMGQPWPVIALAGAGLHLTLMFVAAIIPTLVTYAHTHFFIPWLAVAAGAALNGGLGLARLSPAWPHLQDTDMWLSLLAAGLWAASSVGYVTAGQWLRSEAAHWSEDLLLSDGERLRVAFARFFETLFNAFRVTYGARRAKAVDDDMDVIAVAADWDVEVNSGCINDELDLTQITILEQADRYRDLLGRAIDLMDDWAGSAFIERATQAAYDSLPWPERETLGQYILAGSPWGGAIAGQFNAVRSERYHLLQQVPLLSSCNNRALALIMAAIKSESVPAGTVLGRQGESVTRFVIVQSGAVEKWVKAPARAGVPTRVGGPVRTGGPDSGDGHISPHTGLVGVLRRGASLGSEAFMGGGAYTGTYRTAIATDILYLTLEECRNLRRAGVKLATQVGQVLAIRQLLAQMPLFASLGPQQLDGLAHQLKRQEVPAGQVIIRQGEERHHLYITLSGQIEISVTAPDGRQHVVARQGPGQHFGEIALYADVPYSATCRAATPSVLLALDEATFDALVRSSMQITHYIEQVSSGRTIDTRRKLDLSGVV